MAYSNAFFPPQSYGVVNEPSVFDDYQQSSRWADYDRQYTAPNSNIDALSMFESRMQELQMNCMDQIEAWKRARNRILATSSFQNYYPVKETKPGAKEFLLKIVDELKAWVQPADSNLHDLFKRARPNIISLCKDLRDSCTSLERLDVSDSGSEKKSAEEQEKNNLERNRLRVELCDQSISVLNEMVALTNDVSREIDFCLKIEDVCEKIITFFSYFALRTFVSIPMPEIDFGMTDVYRKFLYREVKSETRQIDHFITQSQGDVAIAQNLLDKGVKEDIKNNNFKPAKKADEEVNSKQDEDVEENQNFQSSPPEGQPESQEEVQELVESPSAGMRP